MRHWGYALLLVIGLFGCGRSFDERHLDGIDLSGATISEFRNKYGMEEENNPLYILGVPVYHRLRFKLSHEDAQRFTMAPSGPLYVDEGSSHNAIRVWLPLPKAPRSYTEAVDKWGEPGRPPKVIHSQDGGSLPVNLIGMNYAEFVVNDVEVGLFYDGDGERIGMMTWAPVLKDSPDGDTPPSPTAADPGAAKP